MNPVTLIGIALGLAMDAFAVSIACSIILRKVNARQVFRIGFHFGLFQGLMPIIGWAAGKSAASYIIAWDHWIAFALLAGIGGKAIYDSLQRKEGAQQNGDPTRGATLVAYSLATSIDALAAGVSLAMLDVEILYPSLVIGIVTAAVSTAGMLFGAKLGTRLGSRIEIAGGIILIAVGVKILLADIA